MTRSEYNQQVDQVADKLYSYAMKLVSDGNEAQDLVQDSFMKLWIKRESIEVGAVKPFLFRVLYNKMVDDYRKNKRKTNTDQVPEKALNADDGSTKDLLDRAFKLLKEEQKNIILLRDWEGYSYDEIAEILGINLSQVKVYLFRARKKMKQILVGLDSERKKKSI